MRGSFEMAERYERALTRLLPLYEKQDFNKHDQATIEILKKVIILLVKCLNNKPSPTDCTVEQAQANFSYFENVKKNMALLTPAEFMNLFPLTKNYDGEKYGTKDYLFSKKELKKYASDKPLGEELDSFLWDYWNEDINEFMALSMMAASQLMKAQSRQSLFETFIHPIGAGIGRPTELRAGIGKGIKINAGAGNEKVAIRSSITPPGVRTKLPNYLRVIKRGEDNMETAEKYHVYKEIKKIDKTAGRVFLYGEPALRLLKKIDDSESRGVSKEIIDQLKKQAAILFPRTALMNCAGKIQTLEEAEAAFDLASLVKLYLSKLTLREFIQAFPITKRYDGGTDFKDYFSTKDYVNQFDLDKPIGEEKILEFLWEYRNLHIENFVLGSMEIMDKIQQAKGEQTIGDYLTEELGLKSYHKYSDQNGKEFIQDPETGKTARIYKKRPRYLKVIK